MLTPAFRKVSIWLMGMPYMRSMTNTFGLQNSQIISGINTRFKPSTVVPDYTGMLVNTGSMIFWTLLVVGAMSIFLKE